MSRVQDSAAAERASARRAWPVRAFRLGNEPNEDLSASTTAVERLEMIWPLTVDAWALSGRTIPDYARHEAPIRVIHGYVRRQAGEGERRDPMDTTPTEQAVLARFRERCHIAGAVQVGYGMRATAIRLARSTQPDLDIDQALVAMVEKGWLKRNEAGTWYYLTADGAGLVKTA